jgi:hypothetical protein
MIKNNPAELGWAVQVICEQVGYFAFIFLQMSGELISEWV